MSSPPLWPSYMGNHPLTNPHRQTSHSTEPMDMWYWHHLNKFAPFTFVELIYHPARQSLNHNADGISSLRRAIFFSAAIHSLPLVAGYIYIAPIDVDMLKSIRASGFAVQYYVCNVFNVSCWVPLVAAIIVQIQRYITINKLARWRHTILSMS